MVDLISNFASPSGSCWYSDGFHKLLQIGPSKQPVAVRWVLVHWDFSSLRLGSDRALRHAQNLSRFGNLYVFAEFCHMTGPRPNANRKHAAKFTKPSRPEVVTRAKATNTLMTAFRSPQHRLSFGFFPLATELLSVSEEFFVPPAGRIPPTMEARRSLSMLGYSMHQSSLCP